MVWSVGFEPTKAVTKSAPHSQVEPAIIQGDFWQVSQFYQELIEKEPLEIGHYWCCL